MDAIFDLTREGALTAGWVLLAPMAVICVVSLLMAVFQAVTNMHDPVLSSVPRLVGLAVVVCASAPWAIARLIEYLQLALRSAGGS